MNKTRMMVIAGLLISLEIILTRFLSIQTPILRIGFGFLPIAFSGIILGPFLGGITAALADIIGMIIFPQGAYFPGFTLSAFISGTLYGLFLYKKPNSILHIFLSVLLITVFVDLGLNTVWLSMITGKAAIILIMPRLIKGAIMFPVQVSLIHILWRYVGSTVHQRFTSKA